MQKAVAAGGTQKAVSRAWLALLLYWLLTTAYCLLSSTPCLAASVRTFDGKSYEGEVKLEQGGQVSILTTEGAKTAKVRLEDVLQASFGPSTTKPPPKGKPRETAGAPAAGLKMGVMLKSGTVLAGAVVESGDQAKLTFNRLGKRETLPLAGVARVVFRDISAELAGKIPQKHPGVLLREGDFIEGDFRGIDRGRVVLSSVLFGISQFDPRDKAMVLVLNEADAAAPQCVVRGRDGSVYLAKAVTPDRDTMVIEEVSGVKFSLARWDVAEYAAGAGRMQSLADLKPRKVEPPTRGGRDSLAINSTGIGLAMNLGGAVCEKGLTLAAGSAATWELDGQYRTMTLKCGVPQGILPTAGVRFIVLADGKELYKSHPRTSLDDPLAITLTLSQARQLTLKVDSTAGDALSTPGVFGEVGLVK